MIKNKIVKNASWIVACRIVQSIFSLIVTMITARYLGPSNYGIISYAASIVAFFVPIMQLGLHNVLVQEIVDNPEKEGIVLGTSIILSLLSAVASIVCIIVFVLLVNANETETIIVCGLYSILLIFQALELIQYWFQAKYLSKYASIVSLIAYTIVSFYKIVLLISGSSVYWFAVSNAIDFMLIAFALLYFYKKLGGAKLKFSKEVARVLFDKSKHYIISGLMIVILSQTDRVMIKIMIDNKAVGYYSAAVSIACMTNFVFNAIIDSMRPSIFEKKKISNEEYLNSLKLLYSIIIYCALLQSLVITIFSNIIVNILYGSAYLESVSALQIIVWYTAFSYIGAVRNIWILAENNQKYLWIINMSGAILNILLNLVFIPTMGINGASLASLLTQIFTNVILGFIIKPIRPNNNIMLQSINPKYIFNIFKKIKNKSTREIK